MHIHFIGVGGTAMGSVAIACTMQGHTVTGSDGPLYPPMSTVLDEAGITRYEGYSAERLRELTPDLIVVGNAISRGNSELECVLTDRLPMTSMAEFVGKYLISRNTSIVCCGTHGKTTTSSMAAWLLAHAGRDPGFLIGGVPGNFTVGCRPVPEHIHDSHAGVFVSEGDEYDTAFFDKRSKFVHYRPTIAIINNIEFDHADIFNSLEEIIRSFTHMVRIIPQHGVLLVNADDANALRAAEQAPCPTETVGTNPDATWRLIDIEEDGATTRWTLLRDGSEYGKFSLPMPGEHNIRNASMAIAATTHAGLSAAEQASALMAFRAPKRRLEEIAQWNGCTVIDDFAHHPTAIAKTIQALHQRFPGSRLHVVFEPRSNTTTRNFFQDELATCFAGATTVCIGPVNRPERYSEDERLDTARLLRDLANLNVDAHALHPDRAQDRTWGQDIVTILRERVTSGDVIAVLSNGDVGGLRAMLSAQS
jgi:UDP-N-acetylmuramate: L-alanyl-gamma-D-glutamyl-meso-diaminopimelate ligase